MKTPILIAVLIILLYPLCYGQTITITNTNNVDISGDSLLTGSPFSLDAEIQIPAGCDSIVVTVSIPQDIRLDTNFPVEPTSTWESDNAVINYNYDAFDLVITSLSGIFDSNSGSNAQNLNIDLRMNMGDLCEGVEFNFEVDVEYYEDGILCPGGSTASEKIYSLYLDNYWEIDLIRETPDSLICTGGFVKYRLEIPGRTSSDYGGYNSSNAPPPVLSNPVSFTSRANSVSFFNESYQSLGNFIYLSNPCGFLNTKIYALNLDLNIGTGNTRAYAIENYECFECDYTNLDISPTASISPIQPCTNDRDYTQNDTESLDPQLFNTTCCGTYTGVSQFNKYHNFSSTAICPGSCQPTNFGITFDNTLSGVDHTGFCITDDIPDDYVINSINFASSGDTYFASGRTATLTYSGGAPYTLSAGQTIVTLADLGVTSLSEFTICYNSPIMALSDVLSIRYNGSFSDQVTVGDIVAPCATIPSLGEIACANAATITNCAPRFSTDFRVYNNLVGATSTISTNWGDKSTYRLRIQNTGTADATDADLTYTIPPEFTFCSGGLRFYYVPIGSSLSNAVALPDPPAAIGGNHTLVGQDFTLSDFDLDMSCQGGGTLYIEIDVETNNTAVAGPKVSRFYVNGQQSPATTIYVSEFYQIEANMYVQCVFSDCDPISDTTAVTNPGGTVWYKYEIVNTGNVPLTGIEMINHKPTASTLLSDCSGPRDVTMQGLLFDSPYLLEPCGNTTGVTPTYSNTTGCAASFIDPFSATASNQKLVFGGTLMPGEVFAAQVRHIVDQFENPGTYTDNDFTVSCIRSDVPGRTQPLLSNNTKLYILPNECGDISTSDDIDCSLTGLTLTRDTIPNLDSCCITISVENNYYPDLFTGIDVSAITGELFDIIELAPGIIQGAGSNNASLYLRSATSATLPAGTYEVATICYNTLYTDPQTINASYRGDISGSSESDLCTSTIEMDCPAQEFTGGWSKYFGDNLNAFAREVRSFGNHMYVSSFIRTGSSPSYQYTPVLAKFDLGGNLIWQQKYDNENSILLDFEISDDMSELLAVGLTYPAGSNNNNKSLFYRISTVDGNLVSGQVFQDQGRERYQTIKRHQNPDNPAFPYYILGVYAGGNDRVIVKNIDREGNVNWERDIDQDSDDQFFVTLVDKPNGDLVIGGDVAGNAGMILVTIDGSNGDVLSAKKNNRNHFLTKAFDFGEGLAVAGFDNSNGNAGYVSIFDYDLNLLDAYSYDGLGPIRSFFAGEDGKYYVCGFNTVAPSGGGGGSSKPAPQVDNIDMAVQSVIASHNYPVICKIDIDVTQTNPVVATISHEAAYRYTTGANDYSSSYLWGGNQNHLFFNNTYQRFKDTGNNNFSYVWDQYLGILPYDLENSNCVEAIDVDTSYITFPMTTTSVGNASYVSPAPLVSTASDSTGFLCDDNCNPTCLVRFSYAIDETYEGCGVKVDFTNLSTNTNGVWNWNFGDGMTSQDENPSFIYDGDRLYTVTLGVPECQASYQLVVDATFEHSLPEVIPITGLQDFCADEGCFYTGNINDLQWQYTGGNQYCIEDTTYLRSDGSDFTSAYEVGTTDIEVQITNTFGEATSLLFTIIVEDCTAPDITCPSNVIVEAPFNESSVEVTWTEPWINDECTNDVQVTQTAYSGQMFDCGEHEVIYTAYDEAGNTAQCTILVSVLCDSVFDYCGQAAITCFPGFVNGSPSQGIDMTAPVYGIVDVRDRTGVSPGLWSDRSGSNIYHPSHWNAGNLGLVFGMTIDNSNNVFLAATTVYGCETTIFDAFTTDGPSAVYKIDDNDNISTVVTTGPYDVTGTDNKIPNNGGALGNIAFNSVHDMCYVTNLSDGYIYQIDNQGLVSNRFDPFDATPVSSAAFAPLGDRPWGIAYNPIDNKLYYSNWVEDRGRRNTTRTNEIWSVDIDNNGDIIDGTDVLVIELPDHLDTYSPLGYSDYSNPVSDIAFGENGKMLLAERSMGADCGDAARAVVNSTRKFSHGARVLEYRNACDSWVLDDGFGDLPFDSYSADLKYIIGNASKTITPTSTSGTGTAGANSAGGIDYGYSSFIVGADDADCDAMVWSSSDYMWECSNQRWYGMQGLSSNGGNECSSFLIDYDGLSGTEAKIMQGDVEVFRCFQCAAPDLSCCSSFDTEDQERWQGSNTSILISEPGSSVTDGDYYLRGDVSGSDGYLYNDSDYSGDWTLYDGSCLCFDFRILDDGNFSSATVLSPDLRLYQGDPATPTLEARFVPYTTVTEVALWTNFCSPIELGGTTMPVSEHGYWTMTIGSGTTDWNTLLQDVTGVKFSTDLSTATTEAYGYDNICIGSCSDIPDIYHCGTVLGTGSFTSTVSDSCCFEFEYISYSDTIVDGFEFTIATAEVTYATFETDGPAITNDYIDPHTTKGVATGDSFVLDICFDSTIPLPHDVQLITSSYHEISNGEHYQLCRDTSDLTCQSAAVGSGCYTIVEVDVTCNDNITFSNNGNTYGYDVAIKVKNETTDETFSSLVLDFQESDFFWNPTVVSLAPTGLAPGQTSDWLYFVMTPDQYFDGNKDICFDIHPVNTDFDYCCSEPGGTCITFPSCCAAESGLSANVMPSGTSAGGSCCYDISLENNCAFGYIKSVDAVILTEGVTIHSHFDNDAIWLTNSLSATSLEFIHDSGTLPLGAYEDVYTVCLNNVENMSQVPQQLELSWIACDDSSDFVVLTDTVVMTCQPIIADTCVMITNDTVICNTDASSSFSYTVTNNSSHTISQIALVPQGGTSTSSYYPQSFSTSLQPGEAMDLQIELEGDAGDYIAFGTRLFDNTNADPQLNYCCYQQDYVSIFLEDCCKDTLILDDMLIEDGDYYARHEIKVLSNVGTERFVNMYAPLVSVPSTGLVENDAVLSIDPNGCAENAALYFDGINDRLRISPYTTTPDFTVEHWFRASDVSSQTQNTPERLFSLGNIERLEVGLHYGANDGKVWLYDQFGSDVSGSGQFFGPSLRDGEWHHVALTGTGTARVLYVDGTVVHSYSTTVTMHSSQLNIGAWHGTGANYEGMIEDFRIWSYAMTPTEVVSHYHCPSQTSPTGVIFHYDFNEGIPEGDNTGTTEVVNRISGAPNASLQDFALTGSVSNYVDGFQPQQVCCEAGPDFTCLKLFINITDDMTLEATVTASQFIEQSNHPCSLSETYSFSTDPTDTLRIFDCSELGLSSLDVFAIDALGQITSCSTQITVLDPNGLCP